MFNRRFIVGDVTICPAGTGHGIANRSDETVELVAVIVYQ
jgi:quercetin dioxygenase-like cupin family protein